MTEDNAFTLQDIKDAYVEWTEDGDDAWLRRIVKPFEVLFEPLPKVIVKDSAVDAICHGADLAAVGVHKIDASVQKDVLVALMTAKGEAIGVGTSKMAAAEVVSAKEGVAVSTDRVFMLVGTYPKMW